MNNFKSGDLVRFVWSSYLKSYSSKSSIHKIGASVKRGEQGVVISSFKESTQALVLFSNRKIVLIHSWMIASLEDE
jgi:hypothetical protein